MKADKFLILDDILVVNLDNTKTESYPLQPGVAHMIPSYYPLLCDVWLLMGGSETNHQSHESHHVATPG